MPFQFFFALCLKFHFLTNEVFLTNMKDDFKTYNKIYAEYFKDNQPCRTTIEIKSLPTPIAIELKVIATVKKQKI